MPGTGPLRRSSVLAREKAIVGKSRIAPDRHQRLSEEFPFRGLLLWDGFVAWVCLQYLKRGSPFKSLMWPVKVVELKVAA